MSIRTQPSYGIFNIPLTIAGQMDLPVVGTRIVMVTALGGGVIVPGTIVNVQIGRSLGDAIPFQINTKVNVGKTFEFIRLSWTAQAGVVATFLIDDDSGDEGIFIDAPAPIIAGSLTLTQSTTITTGQLTMTGVTAVISAADTTRQSLTVVNKGPIGAVALGPAGVIFGTGHLIDVGEAMTLNTTAGVFGNTGGNSVLVTFMSEHS